MNIPRYYTLGAIVPDARSLRDLGDRLGSLHLAADPVIVMTRRRDEALARNILPEACVRRVQTGLSRRQWLEFSSTFFSASTVSFLMGVVHVWTGLIVQALLTIVAITGLIVYHRRPRLERQLLRLGLPEPLADEWTGAFSSGFALVLVTVSEELSNEAQGIFLDDQNLQALLATDRRPVL